MGRVAGGDRRGDHIPRIGRASFVTGSTVVPDGGTRSVSREMLPRVGRQRASLSASLGTVVAGIPERSRGRLLVRHALRIADQFDIGPERGAEVVDRLSGGWPLGDAERAE